MYPVVLEELAYISPGWEWDQSVYSIEAAPIRSLRASVLEVRFTTVLPKIQS